MEKATRERLTGAVIFFAVLAIAVPELLTGPGERAAVQDAGELAATGPPLTTYDLAINPAAAPGERRQQELAATAPAESEAIAQAVPPPVTAAPRDAAPPVPATQEPAAPAATAPEATARAAGRDDAGSRTSEAAPATPAASTTQARAGSPAAAAAAAPRAAAAGGWWVQLGSFSSQDNAQRLARELRSKGFTVQVSQVTSGGAQLHRVRAGPEADRAAATALRERLAAAGSRGTLVAP